MAKKKTETTAVTTRKFELTDLDEEMRQMFMERKDSDRQVDAEDLTMPRINLQQFTSRLVKHEGWKAGTWSNNIDDYAYSKEPEEILQVVPVKHYKSRVCFWPMDAPKDGIRCQSPDYFHGIGSPGGECASCKLQSWLGDSSPECDQTHNFVVYVIGEHDTEHRFALMSFRSTGFKGGRDWLKNTLVNEGRLFTNVYQVGVKMKTEADKDWYVPGIVKWEDSNRYEKSVLDVFELEAAKELLTKCEEVSTLVDTMRAAGRFTVVEDGQTPPPPKETPEPDDGDIDWASVEEGAG